MLEIRDSQIKTIAASSTGTPMVQPCSKDATWIEVHLVDEEGNAVAGAKYRIRLPDQSLMEGVLDESGKVRFDSIVAGQATVTFPDIDAKEWSPQ